MPELPTSRKLLFGGAAALGLAGGAAGIAVAQSSDSPPAAEADADDEQDPAYNSSVTTPESPDGTSEADEAASLASLATVSEQQARELALGAIPGEVAEIELDNENGSVVWSVEVTATDGTDHEVVIDAGNGEVLAQQVDDEGEASENEANEGSEAEEGHD